MTTSRRTGRPPGRPRYDGLSPAEQRVLEGIRQGMTNPEIAEMLGVSPDAVKYHVSNMLGKLELPDRHALAAWDGELRETRGRMWWWVLAFGALATVLVVGAWMFRQAGENPGPRIDEAVPVTGTPTPSVELPPNARIPHAMGEGDVIFRVWITGEAGQTPPQRLSEDILLLYGDGRLLTYEPAQDEGDRWTEFRLTEDGVQRVLRFVLDDARLADQPSEPGIGFADHGVYNYELRTALWAGSRHFASCDGCFDRVRGDLRDRFERLEEFVQAIGVSTFAAGEVIEHKRFAPDAILVQVFFDPGLDPGHNPAPTALNGSLEPGVLCGKRATLLMQQLAEQGLSFTDDGKPWIVRYRPVFPHEPGWRTCGEP